MIYFRKPFLIVLLATTILLSHCQSYDVHSHTEAPIIWGGSEPSASIGYIDVLSIGQKRIALSNYGSSLSFHLRQAGFRVADPADLQASLRGKELPADRLLTDSEILLLAGNLKGRLLLQGMVQETVLRSIPNDKFDIALTLFVHDSRTGKKVAEIRVFTSGAEEVTPVQAFRITKVATDELKKVVRGKK